MMGFTGRGSTQASAICALAKLTSRISRHAGALVLCALMLLTGIAALDGYGVTGDSASFQRPLAAAILRYVTGDSDAFGPMQNYHDRFYGVAFEMPMLLVEYILGLDDSRSVFLARHLSSHLLFLAAGFAGYLLVCRLFRSRVAALFALALFLLHPRIYAHSFFNTKDVPFLSLFMICLWLAFRAFGGGSKGRRDSLGAFALCGVAAGLLVNLRVMGLAFIAVVAAARVCDWWGARGERRLVLATLVAFLASAAVAYYASMPYLWADPFGRFAELLAVLSNHPTKPVQAFQGEPVSASALPLRYVPVWFTVTTPPLALLLGAVSVASLVRRGMAHPGALLRNTPLRFELLLAACVALPLLAIAVLRPVMYDGWRHTYFLWAPFALLAASGLRALVDAARHLSPHLPRQMPPRSGSFAVYGLAALGLVAIVVQMVRLHPHQSSYFNAPTIRMASEPPHKRWALYERETIKTGYAYILGEHSDAVVNMLAYKKYIPLGSPGGSPHHLETFPRREQQRVAFDPNVDPDFYILRQTATITPRKIDAPDTFFPPVLHERRLYGSAVLRVATSDLSRVDAATANAYRALFHAVTAKPPDINGDFNVYHVGSAVVLAKADCAPADLHTRPTLSVHPESEDGFHAYSLALHGVRVGESCLWWTPLPDRPVARVAIHGVGLLVFDAYLDELRTRRAELAAVPPAARSVFDMHWRDGKLIYVKAPCTAADVEAPFFLHVTPARPNTDASGHYFENLDFHWHGMGAHFDGACMVERALPDYPIAHIATGQFTPDGGSLWRVDFSTSPPTPVHEGTNSHTTTGNSP